MGRVYYMRLKTGILGFGLLVFCSLPAQALSYDEARHLLSRTGFGVAQPQEIKALLPLSRRKAVHHLIHQAQNSHPQPPPSWVIKSPNTPRFGKLSDKERKAQRQHRNKQVWALKAWWLNTMLKTPSPLAEKMTLFWHNHFVSSVKKVRQPALMHQQQMRFRKWGLGRFDQLLSEMLQDPALLLYLDAHRNQVKQPNENFARELFELFTLGEGHYTEADIKESARALTGIRVNARQGQYHFRPRQHDAGYKTIFGKSGKWGPKDLQALILKEPQHARFITKKLYQAFMSHPPTPLELQRLAHNFDLNHDLGKLLERILLSDDFWEVKERGTMIKSPVDFVVGTLRILGGEPDNPVQLARITRQLGQDIYAPPNVKGWPGGKTWLTSQTLLHRQQLIHRLLRSHQGQSMKMHWKKHPTFMDLAPQELKRLLLPLPGDSDLMGDNPLETLLLDARYHLK